MKMTTSFLLVLAAVCITMGYHLGSSFTNYRVVVVFCLVAVISLQVSYVVTMAMVLSK
jgi:hypothetical protein